MQFFKNCKMKKMNAVFLCFGKKYTGYFFGVFNFVNLKF
jgi:dihydroxyacetone kinase